MIERTEERRSSFTHGQHMDKESNAGFGTLRYLPLETRRMIYDLLLFDQCTEHTKHPNIFSNATNHSGNPIEFYVWVDLEHEAGIFDFRFHNTHCGNQCCTSRSLRLQHTSSCLRHEYRDNLLASNCIKFYSPARLRGFLRSLTPHQQLQLRRLALIVSVQDNVAGPRAQYEYAKYLDWRWVCLQLPPTLTSVVIDVMSDVVYWAGGRYKGTPWCSEHNWKYDSTCNGKSWHLRRELLTTDVICKGIKNRAPNAKISVRISNPVDPGYLAIFNAVLAGHN